jgi:hypothetical protein
VPESVAATLQPDLDFNLENPDWVALRLVLRKIDEELADNRKHLFRKVANWFMGLELFREFEVNREDASPLAGRDLEFYRTALTTLMAQGENLVIGLRGHSETDREIVGFSVQDVVSNVDFLRLKYSSRFMEIGDVRRQAILQEVLG